MAARPATGTQRRAIPDAPWLRLTSTSSAGSTSDEKDLRDARAVAKDLKDLPPLVGGGAATPVAGAASPTVKPVPGHAAPQMGSRAWSKETLSLVERALGGLGPMAGNLCCVAAQPDATLAGLRALGFCAVRSGGALAERMPESDAILVTSLGVEALDIRKVVSTLAQAPKRPVLIAVLVVPAGKPGATPKLVSPFAPTPGEEGSSSSSTAPEPPSVTTSIETGKSLYQVRRVLLEAGADDVICLLEGECLAPHRVMETIQRSEFMARKRTADAAAGYNRFIHESLPGNSLEGIPLEDASLQELQAEDGSQLGIGEYSFTEKLGSGSFGKVYKAAHREHGPVAVKAVAKASLNSVNMLMALNSELSVMRYMEPHPNVVRVLAVMSAARNYYAVMDYAGPMDLHRFMEQTLQRKGGTKLPKAMVMRFGAQQANAVAHLHRSLVCHRDLKPTNWVVNEAGDTLRLTDFGLAIQLSGPEQPLKYSCGSVPFCAPEVLCRSASAVGAGYDGLAADIWSLAVGFIELSCGPGTVFQLLGWEDRKPPRKEDEVVPELVKLEKTWAGRPAETGDIFHPVISNMLLTDAPRRWSIAQVVGTQGLALEQPPRPQPPRTSPSPRHKARPRTASSKPGRSAARREHDSCEAKLPLTVRMGGLAVVQSAFHQVIKAGVQSSGLEAYGDDNDASAEKILAFKALFSTTLPVILDEAKGSKKAEDARQQVRVAFKGLKVADSHFLTLAGHLGAALSRCGVDALATEEALEKFESLREDVTGHKMSPLTPAEMQSITSSWPAAAAA